MRSRDDAASTNQALPSAAGSSGGATALTPGQTQLKGQLRGKGLDDQIALLSPGGEGGDEVQAHPAGSAPVQRSPGKEKTNAVTSIVELDINPVSGLTQSQHGSVETYVAEVTSALGSWEAQRGTADLEFKRAEAISLSTQRFEGRGKDDPDWAVVRKEAGRRLRIGRSAGYVQEIRIFNQGALGDLRSLIGVGDAEDSHVYAMRPIGGITIEANVGAAKGGRVYKEIEIAYSNTLISGFGWKQRVFLKGWMIGAGLSVSALKGLATDKGKGDVPDPSGLDKNLGGSGSPPDLESNPVEATGTPLFHYLAPSFFQGAEFTSPSASAGGSFTVLDAKLNLGAALLIRKDAKDLLFEDNFDPNLTFSGEGSLDVQQLGDLLFDDSLGGVGEWGVDAGLDGSVEFGKTERLGALELESGDWGEVEDAAPVARDVWIPLHRAVIYFDHGETELASAKDLATIERVAGLVYAFHDDVDRNPSKVFKVDVTGSHSQVFAQFDDEIRELEDKRERKGTLSAKDEARIQALQMMKERENKSAAMGRATSTSCALINSLHSKSGREEWQNTLAHSDFTPPALREPESRNPYSSSPGDRAASIVVSYQVHKSAKDAFADAKRRRAEEDAGSR